MKAVKLTLVIALACGASSAWVDAIVLSASAQPLLETLAGIKFCRTIKDDAQRLKCFDELLAERPKDQSPKPSNVEVNWAIEESKSPLDDSPQVRGALHGVGDSTRSVLELRCREKKTEAIFIPSSGYLGHEAIKTLVRINDGKPIETTWSPSSDGQAAFAPSAIQFIRALPDRGKLFIRASGYGGRSADGEFNLGEVSGIREKIAQACNWPAASAKDPQAQKK
jgi:hypothetical protein